MLYDLLWLWNVWLETTAHLCDSPCPHRCLWWPLLEHHCQSRGLAHAGLVLPWHKPPMLTPRSKYSNYKLHRSAPTLQVLRFPDQTWQKLFKLVPESESDLASASAPCSSLQRWKQSFHYLPKESETREAWARSECKMIMYSASLQVTLKWCVSNFNQSSLPISTYFFLTAERASARLCAMDTLSLWIFKSASWIVMNRLVLGVSFRTWAVNVRPDAACG